jgi:holin-like protein
LRQISLGALQILGLWTLNFAGVWVVEKMALPIPGNVVGMVLLYALLALGFVKVSWFEAAGSFLIRHLAFFFVPITVGLMDAGYLFATRGIGIIFTLAASAAIGVMLAGWISQLLLGKSGPTGGAP